MMTVTQAAAASRLLSLLTCSILISVHRDVIILVYSESLKHINFPNSIFDNMGELGGCSWKVLGVSYLGFVARRAAI